MTKRKMSRLQKDTMPAATKPVKPDTKKWDTKKSDTKKSDRPKVRGLIDFNSKKKPKESPSSSSDEPSSDHTDIRG